MSVGIGDNILIVDLDALLETRLAVAYQLNPAAWDEIVHHPLYRVRKSDDFSLMTDKFTKDEYFAAWDKRNTSVLEFSFMTNMMHVLRKTSLEYMKRKVNPADLYVQSFEVCINCYPYNLSDEARAMLVDAIKEYVVDGTKVTTMSLSPALLSLPYLRENASGYMLYDLEFWEENSTRLDQVVLTPNLLNIWAPKKFGRQGRPTDDAFNEAFPGDKKPSDDELFFFIEHIHSPACALEFLDINIYCLLQDTKTA